MKNLVIGATLALLTTQAMAKDVFFKHDTIHFVKTDLIQLEGKKVVKFAACQVVKEKQARCTDVAQVPQNAFSSMQNWEVVKQVDGYVTIAGSIVLGVAIDVLSWGTLAVAGTALGVGGATEGALLVYDGAKRADVFSEENESDENYITSTQDYADFVATLKDSLKSSLNTDVADEHIPVKNKGFYTIDLTIEQRTKLVMVKG